MPFELIKIDGWLIEVDREATQAAYLNEHSISTCGCDYCQNYFAACMMHTAHSPATVALFQRLGITPEKEAEVHAIYANQEKTQVSYGGWYHLVSRMIERAEKQAYAVIDDHFEVTFTEKQSLLSNEFPRPVLQMEFTGFIPWVLDEKRDSLDPIVFSQQDQEKEQIDNR